MKMSNGELVDIADNAIGSINEAISILNGVFEYKTILQDLKDIKYNLEELEETYEEAYKRECDEELEYQNLEYERSKF